MAIAPGKIYVNRPVRIKANFQIDGTDTDPTDVTFQTLSPSRVEASYAYSETRCIAQAWGIITSM